MTVLDQLALEVSGSGRPFRFVLTQQGADATQPKVVAQGVGLPPAGDPFRSEELVIPWPNPEPAAGDRLVYTVTNTDGQQVVQVMNVTGPREIVLIKASPSTPASDSGPANPAAAAP